LAVFADNSVIEVGPLDVNGSPQHVVEILRPAS
jgi:hypothetical protein